MRSRTSASNPSALSFTERRAVRLHSPHDRVAHRAPCRSIPYERGLALVGDADSDDLFRSDLSFWTTACATASWELQISSGLCSTHPAWGVDLVNGWASIANG